MVCSPALWSNYPILCECRSKHVSISLGDVSYQWSKATALNFSQEVSYLTTALSLCLFSSRSSLPRYCGQCKKRVKVCKEACSVQTNPYPPSKHWTYGYCKSL